MATQIWGGGGGPPAYATVHVNSDGTVVLTTGTQDIGTGTRTVLAQICADELGVELDDVQVRLGDTDNPYGPISAGSLTVASVGPAVRIAARDAREQLLGAVVEQARLRFVAKDAAGVLAHLADNYRSGGLTKPDVRQQLLALYSLYEALRARVQVDHVEMVDGDVWFYTTGEVTGRLPLVGWVTVLSWQREPEVARRQGEVWRLVGFQD